MNKGTQDRPQHGVFLMTGTLNMRAPYFGRPSLDGDATASRVKPSESLPKQILQSPYNPCIYIYLHISFSLSLSLSLFLGLQ